MTSFLPLKIIGGCGIGMNVIEGTVSMIFLADTNLQCGFVSFYQSVAAGAILLAAFLSTWLSGLLTDLTSKYSIRVMQATTIFCFVCDVLMALFASLNPWVLIVLLSFRYGSLIQLNFSVNKVLKLHLGVNNIDGSDQVQIFNEFAMISQTGGRFFATFLGFLIPYVLITYTNVLTFNMLKFGLVAVCLFFDITSFFATLFIPSDFTTKDAGHKEDTTEYLLESESEEMMEYVSKNGNINSSTRKEKEIEKENLPSSSLGESWGNIKKTLIVYFTTPLIWGLSVQILFLNFAVGYIAIVFRFDLASKEGNNTISFLNETKENFCGNLIPNLLLQTLFMEILIQIAAIIYSIALIKMRPYYFFGRIFFVAQIIVIICTAILGVFNLNSVFASFLLAVCSGIFYIIGCFLDASYISVVPAEVFGYLYAMSGSLKLLIILSSALVGFLKFGALINFLILITFCSASFLFGIWLVYSNKKVIITLDKKDDEDEVRDRNTFQKWMYVWIYGYSPKSEEKEKGSDFSEELDSSQHNFSGSDDT